MDDGDGAYTMELQAYQIMKNAQTYKGSSPCPACGIVMNPVEFLYGKGICHACFDKRSAQRIKGRLA